MNILGNQNRTLRAIRSITLIFVVVAGCANNSERDEEMEAHFASLEAQQLRELESEEESRKLALRRPPKPISEHDTREAERNRLYEQALDAAERRSTGNNFSILNEESIENPTIQTPTAQRGWQAMRLTNTAGAGSSCAVLSEQISIDNAGLETQVQLIVTAESVILKTDAILDQTADQAVLELDGGTSFKIERFENEVTGVIEDEYRQLLIKMALGNSVTASFRYIPQATGVDKHAAIFELAGFAPLLDQLRDC